MARNPVQFQKGISLNEFLSLYGTEDQCFGCSSDIDSSRGKCWRERHYVVRNDDLVAIGLGEQRPRAFESRTLQ